MIDALLYAVRDGIRAAGFGYGEAECEIMDDGRPPPRCGNFFVSIHDGAVRSDRENQLMEWYELSVTLTMRVVVSLDRVGDQQIHLNIARVPLAQRLGFWAKLEQIRAFLHMNWNRVKMLNQTPPSANDNLINWLDTANVGATVYGFCLPLHFLSAESIKMVGGEWFSADPESQEVGIKSTIKFGRCQRMQPQTQPNGPFV